MHKCILKVNNIYLYVLKGDFGFLGLENFLLYCWISNYNYKGNENGLWTSYYRPVVKGSRSKISP